MRLNYSSIPKLHRCSRWSLGMDKKFHPKLYWACDYLSMQELRINHVSKRVPWNKLHMRGDWNLRFRIFKSWCIIFIGLFIVKEKKTVEWISNKQEFMKDRTASWSHDSQYHVTIIKRKSLLTKYWSNPYIVSEQATTRRLRKHFQQPFCIDLYNPGFYHWDIDYPF